MTTNVRKHSSRQLCCCRLACAACAASPSSPQLAAVRSFRRLCCCNSRCRCSCLLRSSGAALRSPPHLALSSDCAAAATGAAVVSLCALQVLPLALSSRQYSPRVELFRQLRVLDHPGQVRVDSVGRGGHVTHHMSHIICVGRVKGAGAGSAVRALHHPGPPRKAEGERDVMSPGRVVQALEDCPPTCCCLYQPCPPTP